MTEPTDFEQLMLELINRARANPEGEAARYGIDLNAGLPAGTISGVPKQPLAMNPLLIDSARAHSSWMLEHDIFSHTGAGGSSAGDRMQAAGYQFVLPWSWGENLSWKGTDAPLPADLAPYVLDQHEGLFRSKDHRPNILRDDFREVGIGQVTGEFTASGTDYNASLITQNYALSGSSVFLVGVVYDDLDGNNFYSPGEGLADVTVSVGGQSTTTWDSGGYQLPLSAGTYEVTFSGGELSTPATRAVTLSDQNAKRDLVAGGGPGDGDDDHDDGGDVGAAIDSIGLHEPTLSTFFLKNTNVGGSADLAFSFGPSNVGWTPLSGDWDGLGGDSIGLYDAANSTFYLSNHNAAGGADALFGFGPAGQGWAPLVGDWEGDGADSIALYNPVSSTFYLKNSNAPGSADETFGFGAPGEGWMPIAGDWDGDGRDSIGLYNPHTATFFLKNGHAGGAADHVIQFGPVGDGMRPLAGDWDGDGDDSIGLYNALTGQYYLRDENSAGRADASFGFGPVDPDLMPLAGQWSQAQTMSGFELAAAEFSAGEDASFALVGLHPGEIA